jgi:hypothetical protein
MPILGSIAFLSTIVALALIGAVVTGHVPLGTALEIGMGLASLVWLFFLVKIPWDLYFTARAARLDGEESLRENIAVPVDRLHELGQLEKKLLTAALTAHAVTATGVWLMARYSPGVVHGSFAWLFLGSAALRPAWEVYLYLRTRLQQLAGQMRFPRNDVQKVLNEQRELTNRVAALEKNLGERAQELQARCGKNEALLGQYTGAHATDVIALRKKLEELSHKLEDVTARVSTDEELITGIRAFARVFRGEIAG